MLQWGPATLFGRPYWQRLNFVFSLPTGDYDKDAAINTGSNTWIFNPHYAFTWELGERLELSGRLHYAWISRNDDPRRAWAQTTYSRARRCTRTSRSPTRWTRTGGSAWPATS